MKPTPRESAAARSLAEAILEFVVAADEGATARRSDRPRDKITVELPHPQETAPRVAPAPPPSLAIEAPKRPERLLLTVREAAKYLSIGERLLWSRSAPRGPLPVVRIGSAVRYPVADLEAAIKRMTVKPRKESHS